MIWAHWVKQVQPVRLLLVINLFRLHHHAVLFLKQVISQFSSLLWLYYSFHADITSGITQTNTHTHKHTSRLWIRGYKLVSVSVCVCDVDAGVCCVIWSEAAWTSVVCFSPSLFPLYRSFFLAHRKGELKEVLWKHGNSCNYPCTPTPPPLITVSFFSCIHFLSPFLFIQHVLVFFTSSVFIPPSLIFPLWERMRCPSWTKTTIISNLYQLQCCGGIIRFMKY